ncbi:MAG: S9 family peptidase [Ilumatobacteraceae bacterium]
MSGEGHETWDRDLATDLYRVSLAGELDRLTQGTGTFVEPSVSPDGTRIAFLGSDDPEHYPFNAKIGILHLDTRSHDFVSEALDRTFMPFHGSREPVWHDGHLLATAEDRGATVLFEVDPNGARPPRPLTPADRVVTSFAASGPSVVVSAASATTPVELELVTSSGLLHPLTAVSERFVARTAPRAMEHFLAPSSGGVEVDTWVLTPPDFDPAGSYPVLLNVHGGPFTQYGYSYFDEVQIQAAAGFVVVMCNPRGSSGREAAWGQAINGPRHRSAPGTGWGSVDVDDVLAALDAALGRYPAADRTRVGMLGGSYGGYMASWLAGHHGDRFGAICSERAVNNLLSEEWNSDIATMFRIEHGVTHLEDPSLYVERSPVTYVRDMHVPLLILHSENDFRCPITQAEELFVALRLLDRDVTFFRFPDEGHELSRSGSPQHRIQRAELQLEFFRKHLVPTT